MMDEMIEDIKKYSIDTIVGDGCEGFVSSHDLCRYMIDAMILILEAQGSPKIANYDFLLEGSPTVCPPELKDEALWIHLNKEQLQRKIQAAKNYKELEHEIEKTLALYGEEAFSVECLRPVMKRHVHKNWESDLPSYEKGKRGKMEAGLFSELITFKNHLKPMGELLFKYAEEACVSCK